MHFKDGSQPTVSTAESYSFMKQIDMCGACLKPQLLSFHYRVDAYDRQERSLRNNGNYACLQLRNALVETSRRITDTRTIQPQRIQSSNSTLKQSNSQATVQNPIMSKVFIR